MPTLDAFLTAADRFAAVASEIDGVAGSLRRLDPSSAVQGGRLAASVPEAIESCAATASMCADRVRVSEATCRERAAMIAAYEAALALYETELAAAQASIAMWVAEFNAWAASGGTLPYPAWEPVVPVAPAAPPAWADVRRL